MRLAIFYPRNYLAGYFSLGGYASAVARMGHEVIDCPLPGNVPHAIDEIRAKLPTIEQLDGCDAVVSFYHEYTQLWLREIYGLAAWSVIKHKVVARFDESMDRTDLGLPGRVPELLDWAAHYSFPAVQDAKRYGGTWEPYGAETEMFSPDEQTEKRYGVGFIGSLYQIRIDYLKRLAQHGDGIPFHCGQVGVQTLGGMREPDSTILLRDEYRAIKVFFCLPPMSRLIVAKVFDVMACGTFVMFPKLLGDLAENLSVFEHRKHIVYYKPGYFAENAKQIREWLQNDEEREAIARAGCNLVRSRHTLENMLTAILAPVVRRQMVAV